MLKNSNATQKVTFNKTIEPNRIAASPIAPSVASPFQMERDAPNELARLARNQRTKKKITGSTASHHIQQQIILEAKRQAMYFSTSMKQIAYNLGFDNIAHFSKFFKHNCGMNFTDFKRVNAKF